MKKYFILYIINTTTFIYSQAPVYLNMGSHNETTDPLQYTSNHQDYEDAKSVLLQIADTIIKYDARWNMQVESNFIRGCLRHDTAVFNTSNFLRWADERLEIEIDPHNHFIPPFINPYNFTDLNVLLRDSIGLSDRNIMGGYTWRNFNGTPPCNQTANEDWTHYNTSEENGNVFSTEQWRPLVIWGGGSPGHCDDSNVLGIWKPSNATAMGYYTHNQNNFVTAIGGSCDTKFTIFDTTDINQVISNVEDVIQYAQAYGNSTTDFYTVTVMFNFRHLQSPALVDKISTFIRAMVSYDQQGSVVWSTLSDKYMIWNSAHNPEDFFIKRCEDVSLGVEPINISDLLHVYPNPTDDKLNITLNSDDLIHQYSIYSIDGNLLLSGNLNGNQISFNSFSDGVYILKINSDTKTAFKKITVIH